MKNLLNMIQNREVIGMNYRNRLMVDKLNPKPLVAIASDKIISKQLFEAHNIKVPKTIGILRYYKEIDKIYERLMQEENGFVIKPAKSSQGSGVMICSKALEDKVFPYLDAPITREKFTFFIRCILYGEYSFGQPLDSALIEQRIELDKSWIYDNLPGPPDLRVIIHLGKPIMAMMRVPTIYSKGRSNLHCGAVGVGLDLESETTTFSILKEKAITHHPDTAQKLSGKHIKDLKECLSLARKCYQIVPLGYMGVDIMYDISLGPVVIEINARPGLAIQIANRKGILAV